MTLGRAAKRPTSASRSLRSPGPSFKNFSTIGLRHFCGQRVIFGDQLAANSRQVQQQGGDEAGTVLPVFRVDQDRSPDGGDRAHDGRRHLIEREVACCGTEAPGFRTQASRCRSDQRTEGYEGETLESLLRANGL